MPSEGMLVQFDGSEHNWFSNFICDLIVGIDDATSRIVGAEFFIGETSLHCLKVMKDVTLNFGLPDAEFHRSDPCDFRITDPSGEADRRDARIDFTRGQTWSTVFLFS